MSTIRHNTRYKTNRCETNTFVETKQMENNDWQCYIYIYKTILYIFYLYTLCVGRQIVNKCLFVHDKNKTAVARGLVDEENGTFVLQQRSVADIDVDIVCVYTYIDTNRCIVSILFRGIVRINRIARVLCVYKHYKLEIDRRRPSVNDTRCCGRASGRVCQLTHVSLLSAHIHTHRHIQSVQCEYNI